MYLLFLSFMLGMSLLLPWNSLLKSLPYVMTRVPTEWKDSAPLWLTLTFTLTNCVTLVFLTLTDADSRVIKRITGRKRTEQVIGGRLYGGLVGCALLLGVACVTPLTDLFLKGNSSSRSCLFLFWGIFVCTGWTMCLLQRSVYPLMSLIPGRKDLMIPAMLTGQAMAGIAASMGSFLFAGSGGGEKGGAVMALIYFGISISALILTAGLFYRYQSRSRSVDVKDNNTVKDTTVNSTVKDTTVNSTIKDTTVNSTIKDTNVQKFSVAVLLDTAKLIKPWPQLLTFNFTATLVIFPGLLTSSARSLNGNKYFIPLTFLVFDAFDLVGKVMPSVVGVKGMGPKSKAAMGFPLMRILFLPAFLLLPNLSIIKRSAGTDFWYFAVLAVMAWTSGWGNAICLINGPLSAQQQTTLSDEMSDRIGSLMGLSITFGLLCGSACSFLIKKIIN